MLHITKRSLGLKSIDLILPVAALTWVVTGGSTSVQAQALKGNAMAANAQAAIKAQTDDKPLFSEFKGVRIGMSADEARQKLGEPKDKGTEQDFFVFNEKQSVQVFYDKSGKVSAISIDFLGGGSDAPAPKAVFGAEIEAKPDGSMYKLVRYPKAGYWVSYNRTAGETPLVSVTIQKIER